MTDLIESARRKLAEQAADLINKAQLPPNEVATLYLEAALAVAFTVMPPGDVADTLREFADRTDEMIKEGDRYDA